MFCPFLWCYGKQTYESDEWDDEWQAYVKTTKVKVNPINLGQKDARFDDLNCHKSLRDFITSKRVHQFIAAKREVKDVNDPDMQIVADCQKYFDPLSILNKLLDNGIKCLFLAGQADFLIPWSGLEPYIMGLDKFQDLKEKNWINDEENLIKIKSSGDNRNQEVILVGGAGHLIYTDRPDLHTKVVTSYLDHHCYPKKVS